MIVNSDVTCLDILLVYMGDAAFVSKWIAHLWLIFCNKVYAICMAQSHMQNLFRIMILSSIGLIDSCLATLAVNLFELAYNVPAYEFERVGTCSACDSTYKLALCSAVDIWILVHDRFSSVGNCI